MADDTDEGVDDAQETIAGLKARLKRLAAARDEAKAEAAELRTERDGLKAEIDPLRGLKSRYEAEKSAWEADRTFLTAGITDQEARDLAIWAHGRLPEAERPPLGEWIATLKADPSKAPKALAPYLAVEPPNAPPPPAGAPPPVLPPRSETTARAGQAVTPEAIRAAIQTGRTTGDWKPYEALKGAVFAEKSR